MVTLPLSHSTKANKAYTREKKLEKNVCKKKEPISLASW